MSAVGFRKDLPTKNSTSNSSKRIDKGSFKSEAPLKIDAPPIEPFNLASSGRHDTDTQDTPVPQSEFSKDKDVGLLKSDEVREYLKNTRLMIKARQQQLSQEMQLENTTVNIKALYENKTLQKQSPFRKCNIAVEHRNSQNLSSKKRELESSINAMSDEMQFNNDHQRRLLDTYKMKILDTEKDMANWSKPSSKKTPFAVKRPTYNTYMQNTIGSTPQKQ